MGVGFSYYNTLFNEFWIIEYQIAETKAGYMADTGIAESKKYMINDDFNPFVVFINYLFFKYCRHDGSYPLLTVDQHSFTF